MKKLFELGNRYAAKSDWTDFALVKLCLGAMGILIGINIPKEKKPFAKNIAGGIFASTYILLMLKMFGVIKEMITETKE